MLLISGNFFFCCSVTKLGLIGRVLCKQTDVAAYEYQNEYYKVETPAGRLCNFVTTYQSFISD